VACRGCGSHPAFRAENETPQRIATTGRSFTIPRLSFLGKSMVTIRLARHGSKKNPFYHITVADRAAKRDGRFIERVGFYNPVAKGNAETLRIDLERFEYWISVGGQPSDTVKKLVQRARKLATAAESITVEAESAAAT